MAEIKYIPIKKTPNQSFSIVIEEKNVDFSLYFRNLNMYCDIIIDGEYQAKGLICKNLSSLLQYSKKLKGDLMFVDVDGDEDPYYFGFCDRWWLVYVQ